MPTANGYMLYEALAQLITLQNVTVVSKLLDSNPTSHHIVAELS